jgi:NAD(P)-dependent dehydrogenase (short-subunit alcohol dehydrogenase family)
MTTSLGIITGATGGVGQACVNKFAAEGWSLVLVDIDSRVEDAAQQIAVAAGQRVIGVAADITKEAEIGKISAAVAGVDMPLRFLGLVAGVNQPACAVEEFDMAEWDRVMSINLRANLLMMRAFIPTLRAAGNASIVTVSSYWGRAGHGFFSAYCASKAALISLTQSAAAELAPAIRVNSLAPGNVGTRMHFDALREEAAKRGISEEQMRGIEWAKIPMGRPADPAEIAAGVHFLASNEGSYLTGATVDVNGGCGFY